MSRIILLLSICAIYYFEIAGQDLTQTIRGSVVDKETKSPLPGANVVLLNTEPLFGSATDQDGNFRIEKVPVNRYSLKISFIGYKELIIPDVVIATGKETVLRIEMEESVLMAQEVVITAGSQKEMPLNEMAAVSARTFTIEETQRFAGSMNDPARMVANYAGVVGVNDQRNDIIVRGNSPISIGWRLEGIDIPNPNHFGVHGTTGGPVSMLNNNTLANSDFFTGAFPAEYGNAMAGVFDLKMRSGNNERHEFLGQIGMNGFELMAEGPFVKKSKGSYMASYRYSTLGLFDMLGMNIGVPAIPYYQDISYKVDLPTRKAGTFKLFGLGGINTISMLESERDTNEWTYGLSGYDLAFGSHLGVAGISHSYMLNNTTYTNVTVCGSTWYNDMTADSVVKKTLDKYRVSSLQTQEDKYSLSVNLNKKFSASSSLKTGFIYDHYNVNALGEARIDTAGNFFNFVDFNGQPELMRAYVQWKYKFTDNLIILPGVHYQKFLFNNSQAMEPRFGLKWNLSVTQSLNIGYGLHSKTQPWPLLLYTAPVFDTSNTIIRTVLSNDNLGFTKSHHLIVGYDYMITEHLRIKTEGYYQYLFDVPIEQVPSHISILNYGADFGIPVYDSLLNKGTGENYGVELTIEKFFSNKYYFLCTSSMSESNYQGSDGIKRSTAFNGNYMFNLLAGKEFYLGKTKGKNILAVDGKVAFAGGKRYIPYSVDSTVNPLNGDQYYFQVFDYAHAYEKKYPDYFRADVRISYRRNSKKVTQEWALDIQNLTNRKNIFSESVNKTTGKIDTEVQLGFFPVVLYRIQF